jgi:diaminohydroxyphosphoribosylaminopyrimidine deaminase / 5-amino-6-(5-phosphoribosylamino)uracil reductase
MVPADDAWMQRAVALAEQGRGQVEPNPLVGAVVVRDGQLVGEGWHQQFGAAHAEVNALAAAGDAAKGATLYVTLEPCCHQGKTPPCTDAIIKAGIARVVAAMQDPFPAVAGQGATRLQAAGVAMEYSGSVGMDSARRLNAPYLKLLAVGRPYVHAKWAMSVDGKIATRTGDSQWISNETSRSRVHVIRGCMDGILIGIGTALADNPVLTARPPGPRTATRVVLDAHARLPLESQLVRTAGEAPTLVATTAAAAPAALAALRDRGCEVLTVPATDQGRPALLPLLAELGRRRWTNLLVEGGAAVLGSFFDARLIDEAHVYLAPMLFGGNQAHTPIGGTGVATVAEALRFESWKLEPGKGDIYLRGWVAQEPPPSARAK